MSEKIYLDYAATTPVDERALEVMLPYFGTVFGNTSSVHTYGQQAEAALETARERMAAGLNCTPKEVIFTACGSESDNLALRGGYSLMYIDPVAIIGGGTGVGGFGGLDEDIFIHGLHLMLEVGI